MAADGTARDNAARPDAETTDKLAAALADVAERSGKLIAQHLRRREPDDGYNILDPLVVMGALQEMAIRMLANPETLMAQQLAYWRDMTALWQRTMQRALAKEPTPAPPVVAPPPGDRRFKHEGWVENFVFDYVKQCYLLTAQRMQEAVDKVEGLDPHTYRKAAFYIRQIVDAMAPSNFPALNPEVLKATIDSGGENLVKGLKHLIEDLERGQGRVALKMTDLDAFKLGENLATTPGKVVFQNRLMQLIQYAPSSPTVHKRPLLIVPPWINKFYILDLKPKNSFLKWAVDQGHTVFIISWINPDETLAHLTFQDYLFQGPLTALEAIEQATGEKQVNAIGYCIGGTLLATLLAWMAVKRDRRVVSATFFTSLLDFSEVGEVSVFIDEQQMQLLEQHMAKKGYLEGHHMANAFSLLRENDLIWSFVINNYLLGRQPMPFDILYWNSDSTRMPRAMHSFYLRNMYMRNKLREPGGIAIAGVPIDLGKITMPAYFLSTREDHIAPWKTTYAGARLLGGPVRFTLGASGHVAGVVNPPAAKKYGYWTADGLPEDPEAWLAGAQAHEGSWWVDWGQWIAGHGGPQVPAREPGGGKLPPLEEAPGSYVKVRLA